MWQLVDIIWGAVGSPIALIYFLKAIVTCVSLSTNKMQPLVTPTRELSIAILAAESAVNL